MSFKLLLLEDDELFAQTLEDFLEEENFFVMRVGSIEEMVEEIAKYSYDLYLLDIKLPDGNALDMLRDFRQLNDDTPAIFLTSYKDEEKLKEGLRVGADDFLRKPIDLEELVLRLHAVLRRCYGSEYIKIGNITFNMNNLELRKDGVRIACKQKELKLLSLFFKRRGQVVSKEEIIATLWRDEEPSEGALRVYINRLKKIFGKEAITNIRGVGYRFEK